MQRFRGSLLDVRRVKGHMSLRENVLREDGNQSYAPRLVKLNFPKFRRSEEPTSWKCRAEQFFRFHETPAEDQVALASFHLEGEAQLWYQLLQQETDTTTWATFKTGLLARYGPTQFYDHFGELTKLQQTSTVKYQSRFEQLLAKVGYLPPPRKVSCFVSGLKESILRQMFWWDNLWI